MAEAILTHRDIIRELAKVEGEGEAARLFLDCLDQASIEPIRGTMEMLRFSHALRRRGGAVAEVARTIDRETLRVVIDEELGRVRAFLGEGAAASAYTGSLRLAGLSAVETPEELLRFALEMSKRGGLIEVVARSLKGIAISSGASMSAVS